ncbi:MAG: methyltransferase domain-containing protein [Aliidongia sp.]
MNSASTTEGYLRDFHSRHPGVTAQTFAGAEAEVGGRFWPSSYAWLVDKVPGPDRALTVLDLGCGNGELLLSLAERKQPGLSLVGIDISPAELAAAEQRLRGRARLIEARAQALPLPPASIDIIVSHLALMLMEDVDAVVEAMHRVLKSGGSIACIVWRGIVPGDGFEIFVEALRDAMAAERVVGHQIGDRRIGLPDELATLFGTWFESIELSDLTVRQRGTPEAIWDRLVPNYDVDLLSPAGQLSLRSVFLAKLTQLADKDGMVESSIGLRSLTARKP